jgi:hypothetical protein
MPAHLDQVANQKRGKRLVASVDLSCVSTMPM